MDPNEALRLYAKARDRGDRAAAKQHRTDIREWVRRGGFEPDWKLHHVARSAVLS